MRFLRHPAAMLCAAALAVPGFAQAPAEPRTPPKLLIVISIDQFSGDLFAEYRGQYSAGMKRLTQGAVFPRGYQSHAATETCPGHSTILTGSRPARTGIIANDWVDQTIARPDKNVYCAEDETASAGSHGDLSGMSAAYVASPAHLRVPTLGGRMKAANPAARVVSVAGKDRAAIMMGGPNTDQSWWMGPKGFMSYAGTTPTPLVAKINSAIATQLGQERPASPLPPVCAQKDIPIAVGSAGRVVGTGRFARKPGDLAAFRASPEQDQAVLRLASGLVDELKLGQQAQTDILSIGLSANDYIGHMFGTEGTEMCLQQFALDQELGAFFDKLDTLGIDYEVALTADHGGHDLPERNTQNAMPMEARMDAALAIKAVNAALAQKLKLATPGALLLGAIPGDVYASTALKPGQRARVLAEASRMLAVHPQVQVVLTKAEIAATPSPTGAPESWSLVQEARASFDPQRSGDLLVLLKPRITSIIDPTKGAVATHGSPWDLDRRVPILFWRKGMQGFEQPIGVETVDIMPTLAAQIGLPVPASEIDGRCLDLIPGPGDSCL